MIAHLVDIPIRTLEAAARYCPVLLEQTAVKPSSEGIPLKEDFQDTP